jgi:O-antigen/teichoic acid export membrane protein
MRRLFVKNLLLLQGLNLIIKPVWLLLIDRTAQNMLGEVVYGEYYIILNLTLISNIVLDIGIQNFNNASVAADNSFFKANFKNIIGAKLLLSVAYLLIVGGIGYSSGMNTDLLFILLTNQVVISFILYFRSNVNGLHAYTLDSLLSVSDKFFGILFCLAFFFSSRISIFYFALAQLLASSLSLIIALLLNLRYYRALPSAGGSMGNIGILFRKSVPYALLFALMGLYTKGDVLMMEWLLPDAVVHCGLYAQSVRLLDASNMFAMLFAGLLLPMFAKLIADRKDVKPLANTASILLILVSLTVSLASILMGEQLMDLLYDYDTYEQLRISSMVFRNIMLCFIPMSLIYVFSTLLTAKGDIWYMNIFALIALSINIGLNLFLIPEYKSFGASLGSLVTQSVFSLLCIGRCFKLFSFRFETVTILRCLVFVVCLTGVYFAVKGLHNFWLILLIYSVAAMILPVLLRMVDVRKIFQILAGRRQ